jgi:Mg-chelatase subunit ChlD
MERNLKDLIMKNKNNIQCNCHCETNSTDICILIDRSGSMASMLDGAISGFNEFINKQKEISGKCKVWITQFDDQPEMLYENTDIHNIAPRNKNNFIPRGWTALYDGIGYLWSLYQKSTDKSNKVIFIIITDGEENFSTLYNKEKIKNIIQTSRECGHQWVFIGSNADAILSGGSIGISRNACLNYEASNEGMNKAYSVLSSSAVSYRSGQCQTMNFTNEN